MWWVSLPGLAGILDRKINNFIYSTADASCLRIVRMLSTYPNVLAWNRVHLSNHSLRSLFLPLASRPNLLIFTSHQWALFGEMTVPAETTTSVSGCHVGLLTPMYVYFLSIYMNLPQCANVTVSFIWYLQCNSQVLVLFISFFNSGWFQILYRTRWSLGSIICLRFDNLQPNNVQNVEVSSRLCGHRHWDTLDFSHSERWWDAIWFFRNSWAHFFLA
jgi:hypothetical protein